MYSNGEGRKEFFREMSDLKTLKDLKGIVISREAKFAAPEAFGDFIHKSELKQEAIKWIKHLLHTQDWKTSNNTIFWIKDFFNITEEELK